MANILIVDDDEMIRLAEGRIIEQAGHTPIFAGDGEAGLQMYMRTRSPSLSPIFGCPRWMG